MRRGAEFDSTGTYRYCLWREWDGALPSVAFVMLNPSTADAERDDPTIRRCMGFARGWGFGRLDVVNLFGYRASSPPELLMARDPVGGGNADAVEATLTAAGRVVLAWGNEGVAAGARRRELLVSGRWCLGLTAQGEPRHPLYVASAARPLAVGWASKRFLHGSTDL